MIARLGVATVLVALQVPFVLGSPAAHAVPANDAGAVKVQRTLVRAHLEADGTDTVADSRTVSLSVDQTRQLHSRQPVTVSWSGAHPTGGIVADANASVARLQEYPMVLLECRGTDSVASPLTPQTCWTQSVQERFQRDNQTGFPPYRVDRRASATDRAAVVNAPTPRPVSCGSPARSEHWLPLVSVTGAVYNSNLSLCGSQAPEASNVGGAGQPSNTTYAITQPDGSGSVRFTVWTKEDNATLGCSDTVACSLVAVPVMGISCDETGSAPPPSVLDKVKSDCRSVGSYAPGAPNQNGAGNALSVSGALWWSASNWTNRISVPLNFAPPADVCDIGGGSKGLDVYGSELLVQATTQWRPHFCLDAKATPFKHIQVGEPQARSLLTNGTISAAFTSDVPAEGYGRPVVNAPTALSGFSISYAVDDAAGQEVTDLRLSARLLAKLLTQSYPALTPIRNEYEALSNNPLNLTLDPEFIALNPGITQGVSASAAASELFSLSSDSDVIEALTNYLTADKDARAFLDGTPDPWGMVVNPSYKGIALPVDNWPQRDTFEPAGYYASGQNECLQNAPVPFLPLVSAPTARLSSIALALQFALSNPQIDCQAIPGATDGVGSKLVALGRQQPGYRFMLGVTSLGDARRYALRSAALQAPSGTTFAAPTETSLAAAGALLVPQDKGGAWTLPLAQLAAHPAAYPGTMPVFTSVVTSGLNATDAKGYADLLRFVAGDGQKPGLDVGQLPPGFVALTANPSLKALAAYTLRAADAVAAQKAELVPLVAPVVSPTPRATPVVTHAPVPPPAPIVVAPTPFVVPSAPAPKPVPPVLVAAQARLTPVPFIGLAGGSAAGYLPLLVLVCLVSGFAAATAARATR